MEKKKLSLQEIQVNSFVTQSGELKETINGGNDSAGIACITFEASTVVTPTTLSLATGQIGTGLTSILVITIKTQGPNLQSDMAVACSRFICQTYGNLTFPCAAV